MWYIICMNNLASIKWCGVCIPVNSAGGGITLAITVLQAVLVIKI